MTTAAPDFDSADRLQFVMVARPSGTGFSCSAMQPALTDTAAFARRCSPRQRLMSTRPSQRELAKRFDWLDKHLASTPYLHRGTFSVADVYAFVVIGWRDRRGTDDPVLQVRARGVIPALRCCRRLAAVRPPDLDEALGTDFSARHYFAAQWESDVGTFINHTFVCNQQASIFM
jgi:hypothetical protein